MVINRFRDGVFYAMLVCQQDNEMVLIDARPSDAIALAVRLGCEIYAYENVIQEAGIIMDDLDEDETPDQSDPINKVQNEPDLDLLTLSELEDLLQEAVDDEDYAKAAQIRDKIKGRSY